MAFIPKELNENIDTSGSGCRGAHYSGCCRATLATLSQRATIRVARWHVRGVVMRGLSIEPLCNFAREAACESIRRHVVGGISSLASAFVCRTLTIYRRPFTA